MFGKILILALEISLGFQFYNVLAYTKQGSNIAIFSVRK